MRYNQLTYHKANPFYKQDFLPDRAWYNRKPKQFPSEIPTGQEYFTDNGRKHYTNKFNHSEIASQKILESPQRYVFQNRIALDKGYMRNLDTIDIEGATSGTRINQSIKNKLRAQQQLARRYNVSLDMSEHKQKNYDQKKRMIAFKQYETLKQRKQKQVQDQIQTLNASRISQNYDKYYPKQEASEQGKNNGYNQYNQQGAQQIKLLPKPYYSKISPNPQNQKYNHKQIIQDKIQNQKSKIERQQSKPAQNHFKLQQNSYKEQIQKYQQQHQLSNNYRYKNNPEVYQSMDAEWNRRRQQYTKNIELEEITKQKMQDKRQFRKNNPTNLSFNLAAQSIVANNMH